MNAFLGIKIILAFVIIFVSILLIPLMLIMTWIDNIHQKQIEKYFKSIGCERYLIETAIFGSNHHYGWRRETPYLFVRDIELQYKKLKQIKKEYK